MNPFSGRNGALSGRRAGLSSVLGSARPGALAPLPLQSRVVGFGDSITANAHTVSTFNDSHNLNGFLTHAHALAGAILFEPSGGNQGVSGNTTAQMVARLSTATAINPKVSIVLGGTNDAQGGIPAATTQSNLATIYAAFRGVGARIIAVTIPRSFAPNALSGANEAIRTAVNAWIASQAAPDLKVVDADAVLTATGQYADGLHPNAAGAAALGASVAVPLAAWTDQTIKAHTAWTAGNSYLNNIDLTGTGGGKTSATGTVADSWAIDASGAGGATVVGSKTTDGGLNQQVIAVSGTYTGDNKSLTFTQGYNGATKPAAGDLMEAILDFEVMSPLTNIRSISLENRIFTPAFGNLIWLYTGFSGTDEDFPLGVGRYVMRSPVGAIPAGTVGQISSDVVILFRNAGASTLPVAAGVKIHKAAIRKVPAGL